MSGEAHKEKWRPALWMVVFGVITFVALVPLSGLLLVIGLESVFGFSVKLRSFTGFMSLAIGSLVMAGLIGGILLRALLRPMQFLIERTEEIERGQANAFRPLEMGGTKEITTLGDRFFWLARRLSDRSNYLTLFVTHLSHELKTPLTSIHGAAELLRDDGDSMDAKQQKRFLQNIIDDTDRLTALSGRLRELAQADVADTDGQCALNQVIIEAADHAGLELEINEILSQTIPMSSENAAIIWRNLATNAANHGATKFTVTGLETDGELRLLISDNGTPISKANREQLFTPFFTTRREEGGTGMGLGITEAMLRSHGGSIVVSEVDGVKFEVVVQGVAEGKQYCV